MEWGKCGEFYKRIAIDMLFSIVTYCYLVKLRALNQELDKNTIGVVSAIQALQSHGDAPILYFVFACFLVLTSIFIVVLSFKKIRGDVLAGGTFIIDFSINLYWICQIWEAINNPILRLILIVLGAGAFLISALGS